MTGLSAPRRSPCTISASRLSTVVLAVEPHNIRSNYVDRLAVDVKGKCFGCVGSVRKGWSCCCRARALSDEEIVRIGSVSNCGEWYTIVASHRLYCESELLVAQGSLLWESSGGSGQCEEVWNVHLVFSSRLWYAS